MGRLILLDTSELLRPLPRKLHAAWAEIDGRKATMSPTVGLELAPHGLLATTSDGLTTAERLLQTRDAEAVERATASTGDPGVVVRCMAEPGVAVPAAGNERSTSMGRARIEPATP